MNDIYRDEEYVDFFKIAHNMEFDIDEIDRMKMSIQYGLVKLMTLL